ncbi:hypothetical protein CTRI78_v001961 [Colletotrichum trifolii]|uniref:Uncharacterized protein n=1 Tax=Colletotrichum trifolii TaxID=5466 RepID=A0A4R8RNH1_COLTR|nr:hypothetical protein CTRI78_v001961 [Colletotrichum trifolii]
MTFNPSPKNPELRYSESLSWLEDLPQQQNKASQAALVPSQNPVIPPNSSPRDISTQEPDILLSIVPKRLYSNGPFGLRARKATPAYFTSKVLLGQLLAYPSMLAKGSRLPPFIFPRCVLEGMISVTDCSSRGYHQCLPEVLAICCSLVQSFEARTPGSTAFVWRTIYGEIYRIEREYRSFTADELIATLQALAIYNLLQASDLDSVPHNNVKAILSLPLFVAKQLYLLKYDYDTNLIEGAALDRREWVCRETIRRTACLLFGFELLVDLDSKREVSKCSSYHSVAAPCGRKLWEPVSNIEWTARYREMEDEIRKKPLVLDDLAVMRRATRAGARRTAEDDELMARVSDWCDSLDEFGSLVWMAVMMEFDA